MGRTEFLTRMDYERALVGAAAFHRERNGALTLSAGLKCAQKMLDTADIVREEIFHQPTGSGVYYEQEWL